MKYYLFKKRITRVGKEQQYELISTHTDYEDAEQTRYKVVIPYLERKKVNSNNINEWIEEEYPIREEGTFRVRYIL